MPKAKGKNGMMDGWMDGWMMCACMHAHEEKTMWVSRYVNNKSVLYFLMN
jgi:hypothetical protein